MDCFSSCIRTVFSSFRCISLKFRVIEMLVFPVSINDHKTWAEIPRLFRSSLAWAFCFTKWGPGAHLYSIGLNCQSNIAGDHIFSRWFKPTRFQCNTSCRCGSENFPLCTKRQLANWAKFVPIAWPRSSEHTEVLRCRSGNSTIPISLSMPDFFAYGPYEFQNILTLRRGTRIPFYLLSCAPFIELVKFALVCMSRLFSICSAPYMSFLFPMLYKQFVLRLLSIKCYHITGFSCPKTEPCSGTERLEPSK